MGNQLETTMHFCTELGCGLPGTLCNLLHEGMKHLI